MKVTITNNVALATTNITKADFAKVAKQKPELLEIKDSDKKVIFKACLGAGNGAANKYGCELVEGVNGKLGITIPLTAGITADEAKAVVYDKLGGAVPFIEKIEKAVADNIGAINEAEAKFMEGITVTA